MTSEQVDVLLATCIASFLPPFMSSSLNLAIPAIGVQFGASAVAVNWVVASYLIASAAFLLPFGRLGDVVGRKRVFLTGMLAHAFFSIASGLATSVASLIAFRVLQGIGGAMAFATSVAILTGAFPQEDRGRVLGINSAAVYVGLSLGPVAGGLLTQHVGWRSIFFVNAVLGLAVAAVMMLRVKHEWRGSDGESFDATGAALYTMSLAALVGGFSTLKTFPAAHWPVLLGGTGLVAFVVRELRAAHPVLDLRLFRNVVFAFSNVAALANYSSTFAVTFLLSLYLQTVRGLEPQTAGAILLAQPVLMALLSPLAGRLSDRIEPRLVASLGMILTSLALALFARLGPSTPLLWVVAELMLIGIGFALFSSPNTNAVMSSISGRHYGVGAATLGTMRLVGQALSMAFVALVFAQFMGNAQIGRETAPLLIASSRFAFAFFAALCGAGTLASLARGRVRPHTVRR
jgi:EmrB/QacA subfamily drug resistance transporter